MSVLIAACVGVVLSWLTLGRVRFLPAPPAAGSGDHTVDTTIVIPARNEALSLPTLLRSLQDSHPRAAEVIVVDDDSVDDTATIAQAAGVTLVQPGDLRDGWAGKPSACATGAAQAHGDVLVFLDADVRLHPHAVAAVTDIALLHPGLCSVQPYHQTEAAYEQFSLVFNIVALMGSGQFGVVQARSSVRAATAFGPCLATRQSSYQAVGGHAAAPATVIDDIAMAKLYALHGLPTPAWLGGRLVRYRMYPGGLRSLIEGWTKNIALGAANASWLSTGLAVAWVTSLLWASADFVLAMARWIGGGQLPWLALAGFTVVGAQVQLLARLLGKFRWWVGVATPVLLVAFLLIFFRSSVLVVLGRPVQWRGRSVATRERRNDPTLK